MKRLFKDPIMFISSFFIICVLLFAVVLRIDVWINETGFFGDESALVSIIKHRNIFQLFSALEFAQACPYFFLLFNKIIYSIFGLNETFLRFFSFISGLLSLFLFPFLASKIFKSKMLVLLSTIFMVFNWNLMYYSQCFKQYSSDVFFTEITIFLFLLFKEKIISSKRALFCGIYFALSIFFSFSVVFIVFPIFLYFIYEFIKKDKKVFVFYILVPYIFSLMIEYFFCLQGTIGNGIIQTWNNEVFALAKFSEFSYMVVYMLKTNVFHSFFVPLFLFGIICIVITNRLFAYIFVFPFLLNIISALLNLYPFVANRSTVYLIPIFCLICFYPLDIIYKKMEKYNIFLECLIFIVSIYSFFYFFSNILKPDLCTSDKKYYFVTSSAKEYVKLLNKRQILDDDIIFVDTQGQGSFALYDISDKYINNVVYMIFNKPIDFYIVRPNKSDVLGNLNDLAKGTCIYFYNSDFYKYAVDVESVKEWIKNNTEIIYKEDDTLGEFLYVKKIT